MRTISQDKLSTKGSYTTLLDNEESLKLTISLKLHQSS